MFWRKKCIRHVCRPQEQTKEHVWLSNWGTSGIVCVVMSDCVFMSITVSSGVRCAAYIHLQIFKRIQLIPCLFWLCQHLRFYSSTLTTKGLTPPPPYLCPSGGSSYSAGFRQQQPEESHPGAGRKESQYHPVWRQQYVLCPFPKLLDACVSNRGWTTTQAKRATSPGTPLKQ